ncbi:uncharacterized protein B0H18DRAFT_1118235, partial [Fomitopsis serialis]
SDEDVSGDQLIDEDDSEMVVTQGKDKKSARAKNTKPRQRVKLADLPPKIRALAVVAQNSLRLTLSLESAWTSDSNVSSPRLLANVNLTAEALKDARKGKNKDAREKKELRRAYAKVQAGEGDEGNHLRTSVNTVVWAVAAQLRNEVKKKAKTVVEHAYGLNMHPKQRRVSLATWLLKTHPMRVNGVKHDIPNFVFGDMELAWNKDGLDTKKCRVSPEQPFRHPAIAEIIVQQWFLGNGGAGQAVHRFREVPDNLICLVCNSIELGLKEAVSSTQIMFTNRQFAPKWDSLMTILEAMQENAPDYYRDLKTYVWGRISQRVDGITSDQSDDEPDENFMDWTALQQAAKPASPSRPASGPSTSRPTTAKPSSAKPSSAKPSSSRAAAKSARTAEQEKDGEVAVDEVAVDEVDELQDERDPVAEGRRQGDVRAYEFQGIYPTNQHSLGLLEYVFQSTSTFPPLLPSVSPHAYQPKATIICTT